MASYRVIAFVPARGGSKGIKDKNMVALAGKPLLQYAVDAARQSGAIDDVIVSSDSERILSVASSLGAKPLRRPAELATDTAPTDSAVAHFIAEYRLASDTAIVLLQPTSPLRTAKHVADAVVLWRDRMPSCLISVYEPPEHPAKSFRLDENGYLTGLFGADAPFQPRQTLPKALMPNGAIYIFSVASFLVGQCIPRTGLLPFMMHRDLSLDIDCPDDLDKAERTLQGR